jgi:hypothetical protein
LIDYLVGSAIAITGMLALLIFGTEIIRLNTEARDRWQARSALMDFEGRWQTSGDALPSGRVCQQAELTWVIEWCASRGVSSLPSSSATIDTATQTISLGWQGGRNASAPRLSLSRRLNGSTAQ